MSDARKADEQPESSGGDDESRRRGMELRRRLVSAVANSVIGHAGELTALDAAIGDGDHGHNMTRGCEAILHDLDALALLRLPDLLKWIGMKLVTKVGGASGPIYGTLFIAMSKEIPAEPTRADLASAFAAAIVAVKARGKSDTGQKTLLDVLVPVQAALAGAGGVETIRRAALEASEATIPMRATRGRASFLGERSIGHMDPGARSSALMILALCDEFGGT